MEKSVNHIPDSGEFCRNRRDMVAYFEIVEGEQWLSGQDLRNIEGARVRYSAGTEGFQVFRIVRLERGGIHLLHSLYPLSVSFSAIYRLSGADKRLLPAVHGVEYMVSAFPSPHMVHPLRDYPVSAVASIFLLSGRRILERSF